MLAKPKSQHLARVMKLANIRDSKSREGNLLWVQVPPRAPNDKNRYEYHASFWHFS